MKNFYPLTFSTVTRKILFYEKIPGNFLGRPFSFPAASFKLEANDNKGDLTIMIHPLKPASIWEDLVQDYLELACLLKPSEQERLIGALQHENIQAESIEAYPCFTVDGRMVILCGKDRVQECWFYTGSDLAVLKIR